MSAQFNYRNMSAFAFIAALLIMLVAGCAGTDISARLTPLSLADVRQMALPDARTDQPVVALVLGGGGLRGFAHLGVLQALNEAGIAPDIVVGTSVGAIVGAAYASGLTPGQIESVASKVEISSLADWTFSSRGIMRGTYIANWLDEITAGVPIEQFPIRFAAVATDLNSEQAVLLDKGPAGSAIRASSAVPGVTVPVPYNNGYLIDGGITSLVPVRFARAMGADIVIAVDIYCRGPRADGLSMLTVIHRVMHTQSCLIAEYEMNEADILISPAISVSGISAEEEQQLAIRVGYQTTREMLPDIIVKVPHLTGLAKR